MSRTSQTGVTLSEYAILLSLVAVASIGALSLLGNSTSSLLREPGSGSAHTAMVQMTHLQFNGSGGPSGGNAPGGTNVPIGKFSQKAVATDSGTIQLSGLASGGVNVSSIEGQVNIPNAPKSLNSTLTSAKSLEELANETSDPAKAALYRKLANESYLLAAAQASYEVTANGNSTPELSTLANVMKGTTKNSLDGMLISLKGISDRSTSLHLAQAEVVQSTLLTDQERQMVMSMVDTTLQQSNDQYANTMSNNPSYINAASITPPAEGSAAMDMIVGVVKQAVLTDNPAATPAIVSSVATGDALSENADDSHRGRKRR